jgi:rubredoxin
VKSNHAAAEKKAWRAFSRYIRLRDSRGEYFICPTCGRTLPLEQADAGHYISRARMGTMFDELNVHAQCRKCNRFQEGNHFIYRHFLVNAYGEEKVTALEVRGRVAGGGHSTGDLLLLADQYNKKFKDLKKALETGAPGVSRITFEEVHV